MRHLHPCICALALLSACGTSEENRTMDNASRTVSGRIWTEPDVAGAINVRGTIVADFKPGRDVLVQSIPMPLGMAKFGEFDTFDLVLFDHEQATHAQVLAGMRSYCAGMGRKLVQPAGGIMDAHPGAKDWGWVSGSCR